MSIYSRTNAAGETIWRYDFQFAGERCFSADPHFKTRAKAAAAETAHKKRLAKGRAEPSRGMVLKQTSRPSGGAGVTLAQAADRFWADIGEAHRSASDIKRRIEICKRLVGAKTLVAAIGTAMVIDAVKERMKEETLTRYGKPSGRRVSGTCANRDVVDQLRPILNHAAAIWEDEGLLLRPIKWKAARQPENEDIVCEFSDAEIDAWKDQLKGEAEKLFLHLALTYGPRQGELHFPPSAFDAFAEEGPELQLGAYIGKGGVRRSSRKDRSLHVLPLTDDDAALIAPWAEQARAAGAETIWLEERDGELQRISYDAMRSRILRAAKRAGIAEQRIIHGMRHHAGERMEKAGGIGRVQQLLGHKQITTSRRYARGSKSALRENLSQISTQNAGQKSRPSPAQGI